MQMDLLWAGENSSYSNWRSRSLGHSFPYQGRGLCVMRPGEKGLPKVACLKQDFWCPLFPAELPFSGCQQAACPKAPALSKWVMKLAGLGCTQLQGHLLRVWTRPPHSGLALLADQHPPPPPNPRLLCGPVMFPTPEKEEGFP